MLARYEVINAAYGKVPSILMDSPSLIRGEKVRG
jgi:hypothetical protein